MDEVTQQNAALVEQAAAASESLLDQADSLMRNVSLFKLGKNINLISRDSSNVSKTFANRVGQLPAHKVNISPKPTQSDVQKNGTDGDSGWSQF
jgi:methyl-accepting chemotaxis protein